MVQDYFTINDDFARIIGQHCPNFKQISKVNTGWTNFVFKVDQGKHNYYFRFPNNHHFALSIIKEYHFNKFIKDKISLRVPNLKLYYDDLGRPYTMHREIKGESLTECYNFLSAHEKTLLSRALMRLLKQLQKIDYHQEQNCEFEKLSAYLYRVSCVSTKTKAEIKQLEPLKKLEAQELVIVHGDLNPGNLILKDHKLTAVLDFAFAGVSHGLVDLSRIIGRLPNSYRQLLLASYEKTFHTQVKATDLENLLLLWGKIEADYLNYLRLNHPYIVLPTPTDGTGSPQNLPFNLGD